MKYVELTRFDLEDLGEFYGWDSKWKTQDDPSHAILYEDGTIYTNTYAQSNPWAEIEQEDVQYYFQKYTPQE